MGGASDGSSQGPFSPVYRDEREYFAEISNSTVHAVMHLGWVPLHDEQGETAKSGRYRAQMGIYVKTRGRLGRGYMALIAPFRHWIVYPALLRRIGRLWKARARPLHTAEVST